MCEELFHVRFLKYHLRDNLPFQFFQKKSVIKRPIKKRKKMISLIENLEEKKIGKIISLIENLEEKKIGKIISLIENYTTLAPLENFQTNHPL